ncbi:MAG: toll/interleukin-1 receptor domain-containing protein [Acidobacteriota bacterium]|nr:toll/interleukin-1 receptor domain-containing protein [Acidobacteriota bacterium]
MKVFISWSGNSSRLVAEALSDWLQRVIQAVKPFYSPDIDKGAKWSNEIDDALEGTRFGIICLTPDNLKSEWIHYESGALSKTKDASIWTFLLDLKPSDVKQPLGRFQHTLAEKADILKMLKSINKKLSEVGGESLKDNLLEEIFNESWVKLEARLDEAKKSIKNQSDDENTLPSENVRTDNDKLDEILEILRNQQRHSNNEFENSLLRQVYATTWREGLQMLDKAKSIEVEKLVNSLTFQLSSISEKTESELIELEKLFSIYFSAVKIQRDGLNWQLWFRPPIGNKQLLDRIAEFNKVSEHKINQYVTGLLP